MSISYVVYRAHRLFATKYIGHISDEEFDAAYIKIYGEPSIEPGFAELADIGRKEFGPVFTYQGKAIESVKTSFDKAKELAEIEGLRFHDLRHTFASRLVQNGVSLYEVMHLTGHKSFSMVQRYAHLAPDFQAQAIEALNDAGTIWAQSPDSDPATNLPNGRNPKVSLGVSMVGTAGIEPATPTMST